MTPRFLFICGVARSGTTALTQVLAAHERIVLGVERFKVLNTAERIAELTPEKFTERSFFDFADGLTNIGPDNPRWTGHYQAMRDKFGRHAYLGDKVPNNHRFLPQLKRQFPGAKFVAIIRDILEVAPSWEARARNEADRGWSSKRGARTAVGVWNEGLRALDAEMRSGSGHMLIVEYRRFFGASDSAELDRVLAFLNLAPDAASTAAMRDASLAFRKTVEGKDRTLSAEAEAHIRARADLDLWNQLLGLSVAPVARAPDLQVP